MPQLRCVFVNACDEPVAIRADLKFRLHVFQNDGVGRRALSSQVPQTSGIVLIEYEQPMTVMAILETIVRSEQRREDSRVLVLQVPQALKRVGTYPCDPPAII